MAALRRRPLVIALDVNETLTDMSPLGGRLEEVGAPAHLLATWFAATLRDGIALAAAGGYGAFADVAAAALRCLLASVGELDRSADDAVEHVLGAMEQLPLHADVAPGVAGLRRAGFRVIALTNGAADTAARVLERGGVAEHLEHCLSVAEVQRWKPAPEPYQMAAERCEVAVDEVMLAAVHPWDVDGALRAGLSAAWINRAGVPYPQPLLAPELVVGDMTELGQELSRMDPDRAGG